MNFPTLDKFVNEFGDSPRIGWLVDGQVKAYMRKTERYIAGTFQPTLEIANVSVPPHHKGQGHFTEFLARVEAIAKAQKRTVLVESILEPRLGKFLLKRGYLIVPDSVPLSVYRPPEHQPVPAFCRQA